MFDKLVNKMKSLNKWEKISVLGKDYKVRKHWFWKEYRETGWEPQTVETYRKFLRKDCVYVDVGVWVGLTIMYAKRLGCDRIYGIEANPVMYAMTEDTLHKNRDTRDVSLSHLCITDKDGGFVDFGGGELSSAASVRGHNWKVPSSRLMTWFKQQNIPAEAPLFVKVDIEGAETMAMEDFIELSARPNVVLYLSLHPKFIEDRKATWDKLSRVYHSFKTVFDSSGEPLAIERLQAMFMANEEFPTWGTKFGNFFEITLVNR